MFYYQLGKQIQKGRHLVELVRVKTTIQSKPGAPSMALDQTLRLSGSPPPQSGDFCPGG